MAKVMFSSLLDGLPVSLFVCIIMGKGGSWFEDCLTNRQQYVELKGFTHKRKIFTEGKPMAYLLLVSCPRGPQCSRGVWCHLVVAVAGVLFESSIQSLLSRLPEMSHTLFAQTKV